MAHVNGTMNGTANKAQHVDYPAIVIGAGLGGVRMMYELRKRGIEGNASKLALASEQGFTEQQTWFWNRYPGARSDSEIWVYILTFLEEIGMETKWAERFPSQATLETYLNQVVDFRGLRENFQLNTRIASAHYDESRNIWKVTTSTGQTYTSTYLVTATGPLSATLKPPYAGLDVFKGEWYQTSTWPSRKVDFTGKRVGIFGTGASGVQVIPIVAHSAKSLTVFQRTPNYVLPGRNFVFSEDQERAL